MNGNEVQESPGAEPRFFYGWFIVAASLIIASLLFGSRDSFGVFFKPLQTEFGLTRLAVSSILSAYSILAAAFWGSEGSQYNGKNLIVVDKDIDVFDDEAVEWAMAYRTNAEMGDIQFFRGTAGSLLDPSAPLGQRDPMKYGQGKWTRVFIDAMINWDLEPEEQYGGKREPPLCTESLPETAELISRRWREYGF